MAEQEVRGAMALTGPMEMELLKIAQMCNMVDAVETGASVDAVAMVALHRLLLLVIMRHLT